MLNERKVIRIDAPTRGVETKIVLYQVGEEEKYVGVIYRRRDGAAEWMIAWHTREAPTLDKAEAMARDIHRKNPAASSTKQDPREKVSA